jgi:hypothetical protein
MLLALGTLPAVVMGLVFEKSLRLSFGSPSRMGPGRDKGQHRTENGDEGEQESKRQDLCR